MLVAFTLSEFQTVFLLPKQTTKKFTISGVLFPIFHRLPPIVSTGSTKKTPRIKYGVFVSSKVKLFVPAAAQGLCQRYQSGKLVTACCGKICFRIKQISFNIK